MMGIAMERFCSELEKWKGQDSLVSFFTQDNDINQLPCKIGAIGLLNFSVVHGSNLSLYFRYDGAKLHLSEDGCSLRVSYRNTNENLLIEKSYPREK